MPKLHFPIDYWEIMNPSLESGALALWQGLPRADQTMIACRSSVNFGLDWCQFGISVVGRCRIVAGLR